MRTRKMKAIAACVSVLVIASSAAFAQTLPERARQQGGIAGSVLGFDMPVVREPELMGASDLVAYGRILDVRCQLSPDQNYVETEYTVMIIEALKEPPQRIGRHSGALKQVAVRRPGGSLTTPDGLRLSTFVNDFPERESFTANEDVVVFLRFREGDGSYMFTGGEFGAYRIQDGNVITMTRRVAERRHDTPVPVAAFLQTLRRLR